MWALRAFVDADATSSACERFSTPNVSPRRTYTHAHTHTYTMYDAFGGALRGPLGGLLPSTRHECVLAYMACVQFMCVCVQDYKVSVAPRHSGANHTIHTMYTYIYMGMCGVHTKLRAAFVRFAFTAHSFEPHVCRVPSAPPVAYHLGLRPVRRIEFYCHRVALILIRNLF